MPARNGLTFARELGRQDRTVWSELKGNQPDLLRLSRWSHPAHLSQDVVGLGGRAGPRVTVSEHLFAMHDARGRTLAAQIFD